MLASGGIGLNNSVHAATQRFGALSLVDRQTMVANAHGVRIRRSSLSADNEGSGRSPLPLRARARARVSARV